MDRTEGAGHVNGLFVAEDPAINRPPTEITAEWLNGVQEELIAAIEGGGLTPDAGDTTQLHQAIQAAVSGHAGGADPHPQYLTADEVAGLIPPSTGMRLLRITRITAPGSGTWNKPADVGAVLIRAIGGGGGGANGNYGCGGGSGGYAERLISAPAASYAYSVGAGGAIGSQGGQTTIAGMVCGGGGGGVSGSIANGGSAAGGDVNITGAGGGGQSGSYGGGASGGSGVFGGGGGGGGVTSPTTGGAGSFGGGGGGGGGPAGGSSLGGTGGAGYIEIWEYAS